MCTTYPFGGPLFFVVYNNISYLFQALKGNEFTSLKVHSHPYCIQVLHFLVSVASHLLHLCMNKKLTLTLFTYFVFFLRHMSPSIEHCLELK